jgi:CRISPR system Cascade subunit CasD
MVNNLRWLVVNLEGPLLAFGGVTIDHIGVTRDFPALSMLTGLFANALGWLRTDWQQHQSLQDRIIFAASRDYENPKGVLTDIQNAKLEKNEKGWTTFGMPEGRNGASYGSPHRRQRDYHMDARLTLVLRLRDQQTPSLDELALALQRPARPIFIGRKACLPSAPLLSPNPFIIAPDAYEALKAISGVSNARALWPADEGPDQGAGVDRVLDLADLRNWKTGLHGGGRRVVEGRINPPGETA